MGEVTGAALRAVEIIGNLVDERGAAASSLAGWEAGRLDKGADIALVAGRRQGPEADPPGPNPHVRVVINLAKVLDKQRNN